jgi:hypothetical protein
MATDIGAKGRGLRAKRKTKTTDGEEQRAKGKEESQTAEGRELRA